MTADEVLESLGELFQSAEPLVSSAHVGRCVSDGMIALKERWQRLSLSIVRNTSRMVARLARELNATTAKVKALKEGVTALKALRAEVHGSSSACSTATASTEGSRAQGGP